MLADSLDQCHETAADFHLAYGGLWLFVLRLTAKSQDYAKAIFSDNPAECGF